MQVWVKDFQVSGVVQHLLNVALGHLLSVLVKIFGKSLLLSASVCHTFFILGSLLPQRNSGKVLTKVCVGRSHKLCCICKSSTNTVQCICLGLHSIFTLSVSNVVLCKTWMNRLCSWGDWYTTSNRWGSSCTVHMFKFGLLLAICCCLCVVWEAYMSSTYLRGEAIFREIYVCFLPLCNHSLSLSISDWQGIVLSLNLLLHNTGQSVYFRCVPRGIKYFCYGLYTCSKGEKPENIPGDGFCPLYVQLEDSLPCPTCYWIPGQACGRSVGHTAIVGGGHYMHLP